MHWLMRTFKSSVGLKAVMAVTGICLFLFLVGHLLGNLTSYGGENAFNTYAHGMQSLGPLLWVARIGLLVILVLHVATAACLTYTNRMARPIRYTYERTIQASYASRTMPITGLIVFIFVFYHLSHFTFYGVDPSFAHMTDAQGRHDAYRMLVLGFQNPVASSLYIVGMLILGTHLSHGLQSLFQSLGLNHPNFTPIIRCKGPLIAWLLVLAFISIPVSVLTGVIRLAEGVQP